MKSSQYPNESLRRKLVVAGIPELEHGVESLAARMPDFSAHLVHDLSADMVAELLLYLVAKGIVNFPVASEQALLDLPWGSHVCQFYTAKEDLLKMLVPYFKQGLQRNEACVWLLGDLTVEEAQNALAAEVPNLDRYLTAGQLQILRYTDLYTSPDGSVKPSGELSKQFAELAPTMMARGFSGVRASGSVAWVDNDESMARFMEYETKVNLAIQSARIMAVCTYPARAAKLCQCRELIHNHGKIFVQRGTWVHDNSRDAGKIEAVFAALAMAQ